MGCFPLPEPHSKPFPFQSFSLMTFENTMKIPNQVFQATFTYGILHYKSSYLTKTYTNERSSLCFIFNLHTHIFQEENLGGKNKGCISDGVE